MTYITGSFTQVTLTSKSAPVKPSDPDDEVFLLCAIDGGADYLISEDHSLTDLSRESCFAFCYGCVGFTAVAGCCAASFCFRVATSLRRMAVNTRS
jgi:hypothetical protein